ncbi:hypothetical protein DO71_5601 [Burkholderia pseudomallei]|nr:hypothetical protein DO71_5601 [Burkholderia pseudomallei]
MILLKLTRHETCARHVENPIHLQFEVKQKPESLP